MKLKKVGIHPFDKETGKCGCGLQTCNSPGKHTTQEAPPEGWAGGVGAKVDGFLVIDIDPKSGGVETL